MGGFFAWGCYKERDGRFLSQHHTHACMCAMRQTVCACAQVKCTQRTRTFPMSQVGSRSIWCACALVQAHTLMKPSFFQLACVAHSPVYFFCLVFRLSQIDFFLGGKMMLLSKAPLMLVEEAAFDGMCVFVGGDRWCNTDYSEL